MGRKAELTIITYPDERLRVISQPVEKFDNALRSFMRQMSDYVSKNKALGLAAVQVGKPIRAIVVAGRPGGPSFSLINPKIELSGDTKEDLEGCLSVPGESVTVPRRYEVRVVFQDLHGNDGVWTFFGRMARATQHEMDHLDGKLIVDYKVEDVR